MIHNTLPGMIGQRLLVESNSCPYSVYDVTQQLGSLYTTSGVKPANGLYNYSINANIYSPSLFGSAECQITGLQVKVQSYTIPYTYNNQEIWIGVVSNSSFPSATPNTDFSDLNFIEPLVQVKGSFSFNITSNGIWYTFNFDTPYCYDGSHNLLVVWKNNDGSWQSGYGNADVANIVSKSMYAGWDVTQPATGTRDNYPLLIKLQTMINNLYSMGKQVYALRTVVPNYSSNLIRVRRSSDNSLQDIGADVNGNLDTTALLAFVGANDGFVQTWYDQSPNGLDRVQNTSANQPKIVSAGVVVTDPNNGLPAVYFDGVNDYFGSVSQTWSAPYTVISVASLDPSYSKTAEYNLYGGPSTYYAKGGVKANKYHVNNSSSATGLTSLVNANSDCHLMSSVFNSSTAISRTDGYEDMNGSLTHVNSTYTFLGKGYSTNYWFGYIQEFLYFDQDLTTNLPTFESLIGTAYGISLPYVPGLYDDCDLGLSMFKLNPLYTGACLRVRRSDNAEQDINFDVNGYLDTDSLLSFVGAGDGFIVNWYEQFYGINFTQANPANQPKIVSSGTLITRNGIATIEFASTKYFTMTQISMTNDFTWWMTYEKDTTANRTLGYVNGSNWFASDYNTSLNIDKGTALSASLPANETMLLNNLYDYQGTQALYKNGTLVASKAQGWVAGALVATMNSFPASVANGGTIWLNEFVLFKSTKTVDQATLELDIKTRNNIY
jgi:hypothetical protein